MGKTEPGVSIILPTYNRAGTIAVAIDSVLHQTYGQFELIVVDDGSSDDTDAIIGAYKDTRIRYIKMEKNQGQAAARNVGMKHAVYDYIAFQDSDDKWMPCKLALQMQAIQAAGDEAGFVYHKMRYQVKDIGEIIVPGDSMWDCKKGGDIYRELLMHNMIGMPTLLVKKSCIQEVGMFDEAMRCLEDYDFVLRLAKRFHAAFVDEILLEAGATDGGISSNAAGYFIASCTLVQKYKLDYLATGTLNHRLEKILLEAENAGIQEIVIKLLEKVLVI